MRRSTHDYTNYSADTVATKPSLSAILFSSFATCGSLSRDLPTSCDSFREDIASWSSPHDRCAALLQSSFNFPFVPFSTSASPDRRVYCICNVLIRAGNNPTQSAQEVVQISSLIQSAFPLQPVLDRHLSKPCEPRRNAAIQRQRKPYSLACRCYGSPYSARRSPHCVWF